MKYTSSSNNLLNMKLAISLFRFENVKAGWFRFVFLFQMGPRRFVSYGLYRYIYTRKI